MVRPGTVAHYIAVSPSKRQVVVGLRGTSSLEDILTDCCGRPVPLVDDYSLLGDSVRVEVKAKVPNLVLAESNDEVIEIVSGHERILLEEHDDDGDNFVRCHEGILISAKNVMEEIGPFLRDYLMECQYSVVFCGHSLGAGAAVVCSVLLRNRYPELFLDDNHHRRIRVFAFAPPPVLDHDSAIAASSYCTTVVFNSDLITRLNISNFVVSLACLRKMQRKLVENNLNPTGPSSTIRFLNKLSEGVKGKPLLSLSEIEETVKETQLRRPQHLFLPGRVLLIYNPWTGHSEEDEETADPVHWKCVETNGTNAVFQRLEIDGLRCFSDHLTSSYFEALGMEYEF